MNENKIAREIVNAAHKIHTERRGREEGKKGWKSYWFIDSFTHCFNESMRQ